MTARTVRRELADARTLPLEEWERILRERSYVRPLPVVPPLHVMARRRRDQPDTAEKQATT